MSFIRDTNIVRDADGFGPPALGGRVNIRYGQVAHTDTTARALFTLPAGATIVGWMVNVAAAFNDSTTDLLDIGDGATADRFAANLDVSAVGQIVNGFVPGELFTPLGEETTVYGTYTGGTGDASAGAATVACLYVVL